MHQQIQQQQQQPVIGNSSLGFDGDGGPVPRVQSLNTLPANPPISGSLSVQVQYRRGSCRGEWRERSFPLFERFPLFS